MEGQLSRDGGTVSSDNWCTLLSLDTQLSRAMGAARMSAVCDVCLECADRDFDSSIAMMY